MTATHHSPLIHVHPSTDAKLIPPLSTTPTGVWIATFVIWLYTFAGGLVAVAYTDVGQACVGWIGLLAGTLLTIGVVVLPINIWLHWDRAARRPLLTDLYFHLYYNL